MQKKKWAPIKKMLFTYLAISKIVYWIDIISAADNLEGVVQVVSQRLINRDIVVILLIIFTYFLEAKLIWKQKMEQCYSGHSAFQRRLCGVRNYLNCPYEGDNLDFYAYRRLLGYVAE